MLYLTISVRAFRINTLWYSHPSVKALTRQHQIANVRNTPERCGHYANQRGITSRQCPSSQRKELLLSLLQENCHLKHPRVNPCPIITRIPNLSRTPFDNSVKSSTPGFQTSYDIGRYNSTVAVKLQNGSCSHSYLGHVTVARRDRCSVGVSSSLQLGTRLFVQKRRCTRCLDITLRQVGKLHPDLTPPERLEMSTSVVGPGSRRSKN
ncbi:hypothetical protein BJX99DRAFT_13669 [Aspergillus californicus]